MTLQQFVDIFNILQDKYGSPNVIDSEIVSYYNMASNEYLNRMFPDSQGAVVNFESDSNVTANLQPLIYQLSALSMSGSGVLTSAVINAALASAASEVGASYLRVAAVGVTTGTTMYPVKYTKNNNIWAYQTNTYKAPSSTSPYFTFIGTGLKFYPTDTSLSLTVTVVKKPKVLTTGNLADTLEFPDYTVYNILSIALKLAGISTRDTELLEDTRLAALQITQ